MKVEGLRDATNAVQRYRTQMEIAVLRSFRTNAKEITSWEKRNHPWRNRTFQAEKTIKCVVYREGSKVIMDNGHYAVDRRNGFKYGIALELRHDGRFAILQTALRRQWGQTMQMIASDMSTVA